ncbi:hypothetical protein [Corynebacterium sp.]|uniref:hypothetical protein n=1 Tax=Corynebacterium sp. TaxID=1720 RepID=UPI0026DBC3D6|nr:hypothetical protein [Corynebacterium sp.]
MLQSAFSWTCACEVSFLPLYVDRRPYPEIAGYMLISCMFAADESDALAVGSRPVAAASPP